MGLHSFKTAPAGLLLTCGITWLAQPCATQQGRVPVQVQPTAARIARSYPFPARADDLKPAIEQLACQIKGRFLHIVVSQASRALSSGVALPAGSPAIQH